MKKVLDALLLYVKRAWKQLVVLFSLLIVSIISISVSSGIQTDFGKIKVESGVIETEILDSGEKVNIGFKMYIPRRLAKPTNFLQFYAYTDIKMTMKLPLHTLLN